MEVAHLQCMAAWSKLQSIYSFILLSIQTCSHDIIWNYNRLNETWISKHLGAHILKLKLPIGSLSALKGLLKPK